MDNKTDKRLRERLEALKKDDLICMLEMATGRYRNCRYTLPQLYNLWTNCQRDALFDRIDELQTKAIECNNQYNKMVEPYKTLKDIPQKTLMQIDNLVKRRNYYLKEAVSLMRKEDELSHRWWEEDGQS